MHDTSAPPTGRRDFLRLGLTGAVLAGPLAGTLAGCANHDQQSGASGADPAGRALLPAYRAFQAGTPDLKGEHGASDGYFHYPAEPARTVDAKPGDGKPITAMASIWSPAPPGLPENLAWQHLNDQLGSEFQFQAVPAADYKARFATTIAGGDLPSMIELAQVPRLPELLRATCIDLTEHLTGDAVLRYPNLANLPGPAWQAGIYDGAIFGIPTDRGLWQSGILFQRSDLIKEKGLSAADLRDFGDFAAFCGELTNARKSSWALATVPIPYLRQLLGIPNGWRVDGDTLISAYEVPEQEQALQACIDLWQAGVVHPDAFAVAGNLKAKQLFGAGRVHLAWDAYAAWFQFHRENPPGTPFDLDGMPLFGFDGGTVPFHLGPPAYSVGVIPKGNEDRLETILGVWNYLAAPFGSQEYLHTTYGKEGPNFTRRGSDPVRTERGKREVLSLSCLVCPPLVGYYPEDPEPTRRFHAHQTAMAANTEPNPGRYRYSETNASDGIKINAVIDDTFNAIIQGRKPISDWAGAVATWRKGGGDKIRDELKIALGL